MSLADDVIDAAPGTLTEYAGINLPPGYLWANGSTASRTAYARLFTALCVSVSGVVASGSQSITGISQDLTQLPTSLVGAPVSGPGIPAGATISSVGTSSITISAAATASSSGAAIVIAPHGVGDGSTTFTLPDRRGRVGVGHDVMGAAASGRVTTAASSVNGALLGASGGEQTHTLALTEVPAHTHANTLHDPTHAHSYPGVTMVQNGGTPFDLGGTGSGGASGGSSTNAGSTGITITNDPQGGGAAHPIMQPSIIMNYIIKT